MTSLIAKLGGLWNSCTYMGMVCMYASGAYWCVCARVYCAYVCMYVCVYVCMYVMDMLYVVLT